MRSLYMTLKSVIKGGVCNGDEYEIVIFQLEKGGSQRI